MNETLSQKAYTQIKQDILEGRIRSDTVLSERGLSQAMQISRTPLRSALSRLEREGVVDRLGNGALHVRPVSVEQLMEIIQLRMVLESAAAARAARFGLTFALAEHGAVMRRYADGLSTTFDAFWAADDAFHIAVIDAAQLRVLPGIIAEQRATARRCTITRTHDNFAQQAREHLAVLDAIEAQEPDTAQAAMVAHFTNIRQRFLNWLTR
ncbi:GntR family transcriptional regulator [Thioclava sp. SK-1]|uniref:GntR family transcriptional regulator n=1 Tax=Thioclava sp. SK-1 TaxID=1889770 RepID=UPI0008241C4F|nr:GntR family transcriptional regulator [Thioclava sp. SK-1]OCX66249.1 GntR family transcriptional regulator [Thioclava sp. SK-1]